MHHELPPKRTHRGGILEAPNELFAAVHWCLQDVAHHHPKFTFCHGTPRSCTILYTHVLPTKVDSRHAVPSDAVIFDKAWSPSTWAAPVIGPDDLLCGSCNGLICLHTPTSTLKIANLATGECLHLKKPAKSLKDDHFSFYRFGFHPVTKEYKVIRFCHDSCPCTESRFNVIQVYTLGDEKWKDIVTPESLSLKCIKNSGVFIVDGTMYWLIEDGTSNWKHAVMSFDLGDGSFEKIQLPVAELEDWAFGDGYNFWVTEINGKTCVSIAHSLDRMLIGKLKVWALNGTVDQMWSHMYSIELSSICARAIHFAYGDTILIQHHDSILYSYELFGKDFEIEFSKMVKLLDLGSCNKDDIQFYTCVKSLVPLDLYAKATVVHHPKRQGGWKLKKWKVWEDCLSKLEKMWRRMYQIEFDALVCMHRMGIRAKESAQRLPDEVIRQRVGMEIDQSLQRLPDYPDQHPTPVRRLNWVGCMENIEKLQVHVDVLNDRIKVFKQAQEDIYRMLTTEVTQMLFVRKSRAKKGKVGRPAGSNKGDAAASPSKRQKIGVEEQLEGTSEINTSPGPVTRSQLRVTMVEPKGINQITSSSRPVTRSQSREGARNNVTTPTKFPAKRLAVKKRLTPRKGKKSAE